MGKKENKLFHSRPCLAFLLVLMLGPIGGCFFYHTRSPAERISYEEKVGREFALEASSRFRWLDEPEVLDFVKALGHRISAQIPGSGTNYRFYLIRDPTMNAFAVPGGYVCLFAGLLAKVENIDELVGVLAHEISHVEGNHFIRSQKKMTVGNAAAVAATILAAALGGGESFVAVGTLAQATQVSTALHYSRQFEREADRNSIRLIHQAGFDPLGTLSLFKKFQARARLNASDLPPYFYTHPLPAERIYEMQSWIQALHLPRPNRQPTKGFALARVTAKLRTENHDVVIAEQEAKVQQQPKDANELFLLGYIYLKRGNLPLAKKYLEKAFEGDRSSMEHHLYLGRVHQLAGNMEKAKVMLNAAAAMAPQNTLVEIFLGDFMAQRDDWKTAVSHYQRAVILNSKSYLAHLSLGMAYGRINETGKSYLELGRADKCAGRYRKALYYFKKALKIMDSKSKEADIVREEIRWMEG